jgi:hypothetical protein
MGAGRGGNLEAEAWAREPQVERGDRRLRAQEHEGARRAARSGPGLSAPKELVHLEVETDVEAVVQDPLGEDPRLERAVHRR